MSLKINVIYKGIIYRVKGIKVLCSVVWTVIILLVAIVGMGVWMIINVYDDSSKSLSFIENSNRANNTSSIHSEAPSIDFGKSEGGDPLKVSVYNMKIKNVEFKEVTEKPETTNIPSIQEPVYEYYEYPADVYDTEHEMVDTPTISVDQILKEINPSERMNSEEDIPFGMIRSHELPPAQRTKPEDVKTSESIRSAGIKPSERVQSDEIIPSEKIEFVINPSERIWSDKEQPSPAIRTDGDRNYGGDGIRFKEIKASERIESYTRNEPDMQNLNTDIKSDAIRKADIRLIPIKLVPKDAIRPVVASTSSPLPLPPLPPPPPSLPPSPSVSPKNSIERTDYKPHYKLGYPILRTANIEKADDDRWKPTKEIRPTYGRSPIVTATATNNFLRRKGMPVVDNLTYVGPPVVGYGLNPYEKLTRERIREYDEFWQTYTGKKSEYKVDVNDTSKKFLRPHLRGLRPTGSQYDLPVRPDAQAPPRTLPRPPLQRRPRPLIDNPNQKLLTGLSSTEKPSFHLRNPLQELYDYSKKLAASLLSFNSKSTEQLQNSSEKLAEYGINLLESHNHIFKQPSGGPFDKIISLIPSAERLRSMDPFELSLITWTFLDFWEFLIEKVGTLSDDDLVLLQERLEHLRRRKDDAMTRVFVNETLTRYTSGKQRSIGRLSSFNGTDAQEVVVHEESKNENSETESLDEITSISAIPANDGTILAGLFPSISELSVDDKKETDDYLKTLSEGTLYKFSNNEEESSRDSENEKHSHPDIKDIQSEVSNGEHTEDKVATESIEIDQNQKNSLQTMEIKNESENNTTISITEEIVNENASSVPFEVTSISNTNNDYNVTASTGDHTKPQQQGIFKRTIQRLMNLLTPRKDEQNQRAPATNSEQEGRSSVWDPLGFFSSESRMKFMQFAVKVVFNFGKVYIKKPYALDCSMLLFCKDLNQSAGKGGMQSMAAKLKSVGLKVLTESEQQLRESDTFGEVWRSVTAWAPLQCDAMFPRCDGPKALEIVNEVALGSK